MHGASGISGIVVSVVPRAGVRHGLSDWSDAHAGRNRGHANSTTPPGRVIPENEVRTGRKKMNYLVAIIIGMINPFAGFVLNVITLPLRTVLGNWTYDFINARLQ